MRNGSRGQQGCRYLKPQFFRGINRRQGRSSLGPLAYFGFFPSLVVVGLVIDVPRSTRPTTSDDADDDKPTPMQALVGVNPSVHCTRVPALNPEPCSRLHERTSNGF